MPSDFMERLLLFGVLVLALQVNDVIGVCSTNSSNNESNINIVLENQRSGSIANPQYPSYFPDDIQCTWLIIAPKGSIIYLNFESFDVGHIGSCFSMNGDECSYVYVREGKYESSKDIGKYCGSRVPKKIVSTGRYLWIRFKASQYRSTRFKAYFTVVKEEMELNKQSHAELLVIVATLVSVTLLCILLTAICLNKRRRPLNEDFALTPCNSRHQTDKSRVINSHTEHIVLATPLATAVCFGPAAIYLKEETVISEYTVNHSDDADTMHAQSVSNDEPLAPVCA